MQDFSPGGGGGRGCICMSVHLLGFLMKFFYEQETSDLPILMCSFKAIMTFNLIPVHPQHESLGMRPSGAGHLEQAIWSRPFGAGHLERAIWRGPFGAGHLERAIWSRLFGAGQHAD